jgi:hypothetical protein
MDLELKIGLMEPNTWVNGATGKLKEMDASIILTETFSWDHF